MPFILPIFRLGSVLQLENEPETVQIGDSPKEVPFTIPKKWKWLKLSSVFRLKAGKFISSSEIKEAGKYPCFGGNGIRGYVDHYNKEGKFPLIGRQGALCGNINIADGRFYATEHAVVADGGELIDSDCAAYFLKQLNLNQYATKTAQPGISVKRISETPFPLPSLEEQRRIVTKINQLFEQIDCAEKAYNELSGPLSERFRQLCLEKAVQGQLVPQLESEPEVEQVGDAPEDVPFAIPEKWKWVNLHSTLKAISDGSHNPPPNVGHGVPVLSAKNVINGIIDTNSVTRWTTEEQWSIEDKKIHIQSGDVLLTIVGTIGRTAVVPNDCEKFMLQRSVCVMKPKECVNPEFLALILNSPSLFEWIMDHASGTAQKGIYLKTVKQIPIPLPSIEEQRRIVAKLNELLGSISQLEQTISTP